MIFLSFAIDFNDIENFLRIFLSQGNSNIDKLSETNFNILKYLYRIDHFLNMKLKQFGYKDRIENFNTIIKKCVKEYGLEIDIYSDFENFDQMYKVLRNYYFSFKMNKSKIMSIRYINRKFICSILKKITFLYSKNKIFCISNIFDIKPKNTNDYMKNIIIKYSIINNNQNFQINQINFIMRNYHKYIDSNNDTFIVDDYIEIHRNEYEILLNLKKIFQFLCIYNNNIMILNGFEDFFLSRFFFILKFKDKFLTKNFLKYFYNLEEAFLKLEETSINTREELNNFYNKIELEYNYIYE